VLNLHATQITNCKIQNRAKPTFSPAEIIT
jgi:hypothetical protein